MALGGQQPVIIWLNAILMALTLTALCARVGRRVFVVGTFSGHDALITGAAVSAFIFSIFQIVAVDLGFGLHQDQVPAENMPKLLKLILASNVFYFLCNWIVKHALLLFYSEITREKKHQWSIWIMHFVAFAFGSSSILVNIFQCRPFNKVWNTDVPGYCVNIDIFLYFNASIMITTDLVLYIMPVVFTWNLQLRRPQRIGLNALFALGGLVLAASGARWRSVHKFATEVDFPWWFANAMIWSVLENHLAIVVACAPSVKVIALLIFPRLASSLKKLTSGITPSNSRSRSRASAPLGFSQDLESGTRKSDKLKPTPSSTPLPSPAFSAGSGGSRASKGFSKWFKNPQSPRHLTSSDSMEDTGLVYVEDLRHSNKDVHLNEMPKEISINSDGKESRVASPSPSPDDSIRVEHTITVTGARESEDDMQVMGRAV